MRDDIEKLSLAAGTYLALGSAKNARRLAEVLEEINAG